MQTENTLRRPDAGFTLIEVLVALLILAIGLLGVEALGIGAVKMNHRTRLQAQHLAVASDSLEVIRLRVANFDGPPPTMGTTSGTLPDGALVRRSVTQPATDLVRISVTVIPSATSPVLHARDSVSLNASVYRDM